MNNMFDVLETLDNNMVLRAVEHWKQRNPDTHADEFIESYCREEPLLARWRVNKSRYGWPAILEASSYYEREVIGRW